MRRALIISGVIHVIAILVFCFLPDFRFKWLHKPVSITWVELPRGSGDVPTPEVKNVDRLPRTVINEEVKPNIPTEDQMNLPKTAKVEQKPQEKKPPEKKPDQPMKKVVKKLTKKEQMMKNALSKIDNMLKERTTPSEAAQVNNEKGGFEEGRGNKPVNVSRDDIEYLKYQSQIRNKISSFWFNIIRNSPEEAAKLKASLEVLINGDGEVYTIRWLEPSNNQTFDASCVRAIKKASPFPKPPDRLAWEAYNEGFLVEFDPSKNEL